MMSDISKNKRIDLSALAAGFGEPAFKEGTKKLREMAGENVGPWNAKAFRCEGDTDRPLALAISSSWADVYGPDITLWPKNLRDALATIEAGAGLTNFDDNLTSALQGLQLEETTMPAYEAGVAARLRRGPDIGPIDRATAIPASAARAGLSFVSSPLSLVVPIWAGGIAGRAATGLAAGAGRAFALADEAAAGIAVLFGLTGEAAGFVGAANGTANLSSRYGAIEETAASIIFFGCLRLFGWAGSLARSLLPATETGLALAKLTGHAASVTGLAATEDIQEKLGNIAIANSASHPRESGDLVNTGDSRWSPRKRGLPPKVLTGGGNDKTTFTEKLWRAAFLHGTVHAVNGTIALDPAARRPARFAQIDMARRFANGPFGGSLARTPAPAGVPLSFKFSLPPDERPLGLDELTGPAEPARAGDAMRSFHELGEAAKRDKFAAVLLRDLFVQHSNIMALRLLIKAAEVNADSAEVLLGLAMNNKVVLDRIGTELDIQTLGASARTDDRMVNALEALHRMGMALAWKGLAIAAAKNMYAVYLLGQIAEPSSGPAHAVLATIQPKAVFDAAMSMDKWGINAAWTLILHKNTGLIGMFKAADLSEAVRTAGNGTAEAALLFLLRGTGHPQAFEAARNAGLDGIALAAERGDTEAVFVLDDYRTIGNAAAHGKIAKMDVTAYASAWHGQGSPFHMVEALRVMARNGNDNAVNALANFDISIFLLNRSPLLKIPLLRLAEAGNVAAAEEVAKMIEEKAVSERERFRVVTRAFRPIFEEIDISRMARELPLHALKGYAVREVRGVRLLERLSKLGLKQAGEILFNLAMGEHSAGAKNGGIEALEALAIGARAGNWRALNGIVIAIKEGDTELIRAKALQTLGSLALEGVKGAINVYNAQFPDRPLRRKR